jgi:hypothetical protein
MQNRLAYSLVLSLRKRKWLKRRQPLQGNDSVTWRESEKLEIEAVSDLIKLKVNVKEIFSWDDAAEFGDK